MCIDGSSVSASGRCHQYLRWPSAVQVRGERFGAIAYDNRSQRLVLINAREVVAVAALLRGNGRACDELAPLGLGHGRLEHLLDELVHQDLVEVCGVDDDALRVVNNGEF